MQPPILQCEPVGIITENSFHRRREIAKSESKWTFLFNGVGMFWFHPSQPWQHLLTCRTCAIIKQPLTAIIVALLQSFVSDERVNPPISRGTLITGRRRWRQSTKC